MIFHSNNKNDLADPNQIPASIPQDHKRNELSLQFRAGMYERHIFLSQKDNSRRKDKWKKGRRRTGEKKKCGRVLCSATSFLLKDIIYFEKA